MSSKLIAWPRRIVATSFLALGPLSSWAIESPVEAASAPACSAAVTRDVLGAVSVPGFFVQDETSSQAPLSMPTEAEWLTYVEMHEQLSGSAVRSLFMPWFSLQQQAN